MAKKKRRKRAEHESRSRVGGESSLRGEGAKDHAAMIKVDEEEESIRKREKMLKLRRKARGRIKKG